MKIFRKLILQDHSEKRQINVKLLITLNYEIIYFHLKLGYSSIGTVRAPREAVINLAETKRAVAWMIDSEPAAAD
jgi:hypothetical protein